MAFCCSCVVLVLKRVTRWIKLLATFIFMDVGWKEWKLSRRPEAIGFEYHRVVMVWSLFRVTSVSRNGSAPSFSISTVNWRFGSYWLKANSVFCTSDMGRTMNKSSTYFFNTGMLNLSLLVTTSSKSSMT